VRVDTYLYPGCNVSGFYDSLVAKLITWGSTFDESRRRMSNALDEFYIDGINTTIPLYKTIMNETNFINGNLSTDYLDRFSIIDKMNEDIKNKFNDKSKILPGVAAALIYTEYAKKNSSSSSSNIFGTNASPSTTITSNSQATSNRTNRNNWKFGV
jgi:acetyl-CoA/propionyl-CoA carboxylase